MRSGTVQIDSGTRKKNNSTKSILQSQYHTNTKSELGHNRNYAWLTWAYSLQRCKDDST